MFYAGIDAGSRTIKVVLIDDVNKHIVASGTCAQGVKQANLANDLFQQVLAEAGLKRKDIARTVATGYGRNTLDWADKTVTEITCQAYGIKHQAPNVRLIIDIGGEDSKVIRLDEKGSVHDFAMNDRCAAGTGRFLEIVSERLGVQLIELGTIAQEADNPSVISSMCVVFAETEIIGLLANQVIACQYYCRGTEFHSKTNSCHGRSKDSRASCFYRRSCSYTGHEKFLSKEFKVRYKDRRYIPN